MFNPQVHCRECNVTYDYDPLACRQPPGYNLMCSACQCAAYTGGIAYVKPSEAPSLQPLVYRPDNILARVSDLAASERLQEFARHAISTEGTSAKFVSKAHLKEYSLHPEKRSKLSEQRPVTAPLANVLTANTEHLVLVLHYRYASAEAIHRCCFPSTADVLLCIWSYTSQASSKNPNRLAFDYLVNDKLWSELAPEEKQSLKYLQIVTEDKLRSLFPGRRFSSTRDSARIELASRDQQLAGGAILRRWLFPEGSKPTNAKSVEVGVSTYLNLFTARVPNSLSTF